MMDLLFAALMSYLMFFCFCLRREVFALWQEVHRLRNESVGHADGINNERRARQAEAAEARSFCGCGHTESLHAYRRDCCQAPGCRCRGFVARTGAEHSEGEARN